VNRDRIVLVLVGALLAGLIGWAWMSWDSLSLAFTDEAAFKAWVRSYGPVGPIAIIALQVLQVVIAFIPGQVVGMAAGTLYGLGWGLVLSVVGGTLGSWLAISLARLYGKPLVERYAGDTVRHFIDRFDGVKNPLIWALVFLIPIGDPICYAAGITSAPIRSLFIGSLIGRFPQLALAVFFGSASDRFGPWAWAGGFIAAGIIAVLFALFGDRLKDSATKLAERADG
jgi:uncharacterized membrane protein YdjX (TVP38/TMEM64 family)